MPAINKEAVADYIAAAWKNVPCMPSDDFYQRAWSNILIDARKNFGAKLTTDALAIMKARYNDTIPDSET